MFVEGSASNFPGITSKDYNTIYLYYVLHWVKDKKLAFKNMFSSLKLGVKIALKYNDHLLPILSRIFHELNPENEDRLLNMMNCEARPVIEEMCTSAGFIIPRSSDQKTQDYEFENGDSLRFYSWALTHGVFDPKLVTEDRLAWFCAKDSSGEDSKIKLRCGDDATTVFLSWLQLNQKKPNTRRVDVIMYKS